MRKTYILKFFTTLLFLLHTSVTHANINCQELLGSWSNEIFDPETNKNRRLIETYFEDGTFWIRFIYSENKNSEGTSIENQNFTEQEESGTWECNGDILTITYNKRPGRYIDTRIHYRVTELEETTYTLESVDYGIVYQYFKVIN